MDIITKNKETIKKCQEIIKKNDEIAIELQKTVQKLLDKPMDINAINEATGDLIKMEQQVRYDYYMLYSECMTINWEMVFTKYQENEYLRWLFNSTIIMPEEMQLLWYIGNKITELMNRGDIKITGHDNIFYFYNMHKNFFDLSEGGKIWALWQQTANIINCWSIGRAKIVNLAKIIEYLNFLRNETRKSGQNMDE